VINIAPLRAAKLRSYWKKSVLYDYFPNFIAQLRSVPQENRYWKANFLLSSSFQNITKHTFYMHEIEQVE
jgi:hypothetical protein